MNATLHPLLSTIKTYIIIPYAIYGGAEVYLLNHLKDVDPSQVCFVFLARNNKLQQKLLQKKFECVHIDPPALIQFLQTKKASRVLFYNSKTVYVLLTKLKQQMPNLTIIEVIHSFMSWQDSMHNISRSAINKIFTVSNTVAKQWKLSTPYQVLPPVIDANIFRSTLRVKQNKITIGTVARFSPEKNLTKVVDIAARLDDNYQFVIVGEDGGTKKALQHYIKTKNLSHRVILKDYRDDIEQEYATFDLFLLTSTIEGTPITILEAQAMGIPVIAPNVGAIAEMLKEADYLYPAATLDQALADKIKQMTLPPTIKSSTQDKHKSQDTHKHKLPLNMYELVKRDAQKNTTSKSLFDLPVFQTKYKILAISYSCGYGGAEKVLYDYLKILSQNPIFEISLAITVEKGHRYQAFCDLGINMVDLTKTNNKYTLLSALMLKSHVVFNSNEFQAYSIAHEAKIKSAASFINIGILHSTQTFFVNLIKTHAASLDAIIAIHDRIKDRLIALGLDSKRIHVIQNGIDLEYYHRRQTKEQAKQLLGIDPSTKVFLYAGRLAVEKNVTSIIKAFESLQHPDTKLLIVGSHDKSQQSTWSHIQAELKQAKQTDYIGYQQDPRLYYEAADYHVMASFTEGMPLSLLECSAYGIPTIGTDVGDISSLVTQDTGYLVTLSQEYPLTHGQVFNKTDYDKYTQLLKRALADKETDSKSASLLSTMRTKHNIAKARYSIESLFLHHLFETQVITNPCLDNKLTVVLLSHERYSETEACLRALCNTRESEDYEILIIENGSSSETVSKIQQLVQSNPIARVVISPQNLGVSGGRNLALKHTNTQYIMFLDNDTIPLPQWYPPLKQALITNARLAAVSSVLLNRDKTVQNAGIKFMLHKQILTTSNYTTIQDNIDACTGGATIWDANLLRLQGGLNEDYFIGFEDFELAIKSKLLGFDHTSIATSAIIHDHKRNNADYEATRWRKNTILESGTKFWNNWGLDCLHQLRLTPLPQASTSSLRITTTKS